MSTRSTSMARKVTFGRILIAVKKRLLLVLLGYYGMLRSSAPLDGSYSDVKKPWKSLLRVS